MKFLVPGTIAFLLIAGLANSTFAQVMARPASDAATTAQLQALTKKIDEQNVKIDTLSQQILKLEQQLASTRPGVMIGETTPTPAAPAAIPIAPESSAHALAGNTHTVARGETLTSIAKMHNVTVSELQKMNHIENDRKLQIGQTIMIPSPSTPASSSSPSE